jgi:ariadne-1
VLDTAIKSDIIGEAESGLERLHKCAEKDIHAVLPNANNLSPTLKDFIEFRVKLVDLTRYFQDVFDHYTFAITCSICLDKITNFC